MSVVLNCPVLLLGSESSETNTGQALQVEVRNIFMVLYFCS
jgi:hypothetical protein